jgi:thymidylate synthase ThyX
MAKCKECGQEIERGENFGAGAFNAWKTHMESGECPVLHQLCDCGHLGRNHQMVDPGRIDHRFCEYDDCHCTGFCNMTIEQGKSDSPQWTSFNPDPGPMPPVKSTAVQKWADPAMFAAEPVPDGGPTVTLLSATADPLGVIAAVCAMYEGRVVRSLSEVSHAQRQKYVRELMKTHLKAPLEFVQFHFVIDGVTRAFTHQMVRQRTATYAQESLRFAVKTDMPVGLPPSLAGSTGEFMKIRREILETHGQLVRYADLEEPYPAGHVRPYHASWKEWQGRTAELSELERKRYRWDLRMEAIQRDYLRAIEEGMPAEEARGLLPHAVLTRLHYRTDLRSLLEHAGNRLCTQAQFEWRTVFSKIAEAIRGYSEHSAMMRSVRHEDNDPTMAWIRQWDAGESWQWEAIAGLFRPICYMTGKCEFHSDMDRACSIRERVEANHAVGRPSSEWGSSVDLGMPNAFYAHDPRNRMPWAKDVTVSEQGGLQHIPIKERHTIIPAINPAEWLADPGAAR